VYCPLIAYEHGVTRIKETYPKLNIIPSECIYESDSLFFGSEDQLFKNDPINTILEVKTFFEGMHEKYAPKISCWFGREGLALPLAFEWGCPNHAPSMLYMDVSPKMAKWNKLFNKRS